MRPLTRAHAPTHHARLPVLLAGGMSAFVLLALASPNVPAASATIRTGAPASGTTGDTGASGKAGASGATRTASVTQTIPVTGGSGAQTPAASATVTLTRTTGSSGSSGKLSSGAIAGAIVAGVIVLLCALWALARAFAVEPRWKLSLRHSLAEAGFRASATWAEFRDWARLGR